MSEKITFLLKYTYKLNKINENYFLKTTEKKIFTYYEEKYIKKF